MFLEIFFFISPMLLQMLPILPHFLATPMLIKQFLRVSVTCRADSNYFAAWHFVTSRPQARATPPAGAYRLNHGCHGSANFTAPCGNVEHSLEYMMCVPMETSREFPSERNFHADPVSANDVGDITWNFVRHPA